MVVIQVQRSGQWIRVGKSSTQSTGVARVVLVAPKSVGVHTYQATANAMGTLGAGVSAPFTVTVQ